MSNLKCIIEQKKVDKQVCASISFYVSYEDRKVRSGGSGAKNPNP